MYVFGGRSLKDFEEYLIKNSSAYRQAFPDEKLVEEVNHVEILTKHNHNKVINDSSKDVFVLYYAPWCPKS